MWREPLLRRQPDKSNVREHSKHFVIQIKKAPSPHFCSFVVVVKWYQHALQNFKLMSVLMSFLKLLRFPVKCFWKSSDFVEFCSKFNQLCNQILWWLNRSPNPSNVRNLTICSKLAVLLQLTISLSINHISFFFAFLYQLRNRQACSSQILYLSNSTKKTTNTETAMLSTQKMIQSKPYKLDMNSSQRQNATKKCKNMYCLVKKSVSTKC